MYRFRSVAAGAALVLASSQLGELLATTPPPPPPPPAPPRVAPPPPARVIAPPPPQQKTLLNAPAGSAPVPNPLPKPQIVPQLSTAATPPKQTYPAPLLSQKTPSAYASSPTQAQMNVGCLATVYAMAEGTKYPGTKIVVTSGGNAITPSNLSTGSSTSLSQLPSGSGLFIIAGTVNKKTGGTEPHYMLGTSVTTLNGKKVILANDPWTGAQVIIDAGSGKVINNPTYALPSFVASSASSVQVK